MKHQDYVHYRRLLAYLRPQRRVLLALLLAMVVYGLSEPLVPLVLQPLIDGGFSQLETVHATVFLLCGGFLLRGVANFTADYSMAYLAQKVVLQLRGEMFRQLLRLPMPYFQQRPQGEIISRFTYDVLQLISASTDAVAIVIRESVTIVALLLAMFYFDWRLALFILLLAPLLVALIVFLSQRLRRLARELQRDMGDLNHLLEEALRGRALIRIHGAEAHEGKRFQGRIEDICRRLLQSSRISSMISPIVEMLIILALSGVILWAAHQLGQQENAITVGRLVGFLGAMALLFPPIKRLGKVSEPIQRGLVAMHSVFSFLDEASEQQLLGTPPQSPARKLRGGLRLEGVSCVLQGKTVLENIDLNIAPGETLALVGESGSGKSSLAALIAGFYPLAGGRLHFDDWDAQDLSLRLRRQALAYVGQDTVLFWGSVAENIAYGCEHIDRKRLEEAARHAQAWDFIQALPQGLDSPIGENGHWLSGGQRQRLAIARALYKDAPILILDEATSALDSESEHRVQQALQRLQSGRTSIIIAHRLSTIRHADRIAVMAGGRIVEMGSHEALHAAGGHYAKLLKHEKP